VLVESALIVLSVLLALVLNEWRAEAAQRARVSQALAAVHAEIEENRRLVTAAMEYHNRVADSFSASAAAGSELPDMGVARYGLLAPASVLRTAWESAQIAGLTSELSYDLVLQLSAGYARQEEYEGLDRAMMNVAYERLTQEGVDSMVRQYTNYIPLQRDFAGREQALLEQYHRVHEGN
jgi:hypothetical protein